MESELSDKEWRQMRRQMSKLNFEPVPETPALVPRSMYGDSPGTNGETSNNVSNEAQDHNDIIPMDNQALPCRCATGISSPKAHERVGVEVIQAGELPSTSMAVSPLITNRYRLRGYKQPVENKYADTDIAALDAQMAAAQDATRRSIMSAFADLSVKKAKSEDSERMKLVAAHTNDVASLQNEVQALKERLTLAEAKEDQSVLILDRYSHFVAKQMEHRLKRWEGEHSAAACFRAWITVTQEAAIRRRALQRILGHYCKRLQQENFQKWKSMHQDELYGRLQDQQNRLDHKIVEITEDYELRIQQLQQVVEEAKRQVTEAHKCRQKVEEDLRLVFLRGISAMNIEALTVFGSNHKQCPSLHDTMYQRDRANTTESGCIIIPGDNGTNLEATSPIKLSNPGVQVIDESPNSSPSSSRPNCSVVGPSIPSRIIGLERSCGLRSADMVLLHGLPQAAERQAATTYRPSSAPSKGAKPQLSAKHQVEMQYMRSTVAASTSRASVSSSTRTTAKVRPSSSSVSIPSFHWTQHCGMSRQHFHVEAQQHSPLYDINARECQRGLDDITAGIVADASEEDEIDLEGYEEYLQQLKGKASIRPCSARVERPMPTESPQFYMVNADNLAPIRPARPASARPRISTTPRSRMSEENARQCRSGGNGPGRRRRQSEKLVHARIRAVYNDVGRSTPAVRQMPVSYSATSAIRSKLKVFQDAELHDEYYRLQDAETELKATCLQEQQKRIKAIARVRRLEEIIAMKDKKIESLLHARAVGSDRTISTSRSAVPREMAERDRQFHGLAQKLREKIAQQFQLLSSYEEAMQSLRSGIKSTNLMELEEERSQLYQELHHHQELLDRQRLGWEAHEHKLTSFADMEASYKLQLSKLLQENKVITHEKRKLEQEADYLRSQVEVLRNELVLEQRKRTYDREFGESVGKYNSSAPARNVMLAQALEEMKNLMRRQSAASGCKHENVRSPKTLTAAPQPVVSHALTSAASQDKTRQENQEIQARPISEDADILPEANTTVIDYNPHDNKSPDSSPKTIPDSKQSTAEEELEKIQQRAIASAASLLRITIDNDLDSELSADMLDDAQHPMLQSDVGIEDLLNSADIPDPQREPSRGLQEETSKREFLDELYPSDFLDTDGVGDDFSEHDDTEHSH